MRKYVKNYKAQKGMMLIFLRNNKKKINQSDDKIFSVYLKIS